jgi:hypothetical protein
MVGASKEASSIAYGTAGVWGLAGAYLLHTIGELCASPTALSFITKLAPLKYASIMMGVYFAATGFGNKLAGSIGEASQSDPIEIELIADKADLNVFDRADTLLAKDAGFAIKSNLFLENDKLVSTGLTNNEPVLGLFNLKNESQVADIKQILNENNATRESPYHATFKFEKDGEAKKVLENKGDGKNYAGEFIIEEVQSEKEFNTFLYIFIYCMVIGLLVIILLKPLKRLTHGAEDNEGEKHDETEGFELAE